MTDILGVKPKQNPVSLRIDLVVSGYATCMIANTIIDLNMTSSAVYGWHFKG